MLPLHGAHRGNDSDVGISEYMDTYSRLAAAILSNAQFPPSKRFLNYKRYLMDSSKHASEETYFDNEKLEAMLNSAQGFQSTQGFQSSQGYSSQAPLVTEPMDCQPQTPLTSQRRCSAPSGFADAAAAAAQKTVCVEVYEK